MGDTRGNLTLFDFSSANRPDETVLPYQHYKVHKHERVISIFYD